MSQSHEFENDLREMIQAGHVAAVVGSGVSAATTRRSPTWRALIESGIERCQMIGVAKDWCDRIRGLLQPPPHADMLLLAAESVHQKLRENPGEFARWLREMFEGLEPGDARVIELLARLDVPLVTTNYDGLIEKVTSLKHVTWKDGHNMARVLRGEDRRVLHVHGHWDEPDSVVLGIRSYEAVKNHEHTLAVMRALGVTKSLLFVGCGDEGLSDPNFGSFLTWLRELESGSGAEHRHYRLVREKDVFEPQGRLCTF